MDLAPDAIPLPLVYPPSSWLDHFHGHAGGLVHRLDPGKILLHEGERSSCLWVLQSGAVTLATTAPSGRRATLAVLGPGAVLGEHGLVGPLIDPRQRGRTMLPEISALIASTVQAIPLSRLHSLMATDPYVACWLAAAMSWRAVQVERALARVLAFRVPQRVFGALQDLALELGEATPGSVRIGLPITQDLLASMAGATRESVNRAIAELEERGLVRRMGLRYELPVGGGPS
jgi:CRP-like cAMP-binding protein